MRRSDREITDYHKMLHIMRSCDCCRLGFSESGGAYIVPLNFGYREEQGRLILYFHSADAGKKIELIKANPCVGFEMDTNHALVEGDRACQYSYRYQSIIGKGRISMLQTETDKVCALQCILSHYAPDRPAQEWTFDENLLARVAVFALEVTEWSCKAHL
ncbi:MAG: pyridoxamine 5'-phosphate oxidase family protein [Blautia sp.]|nr:pyridoxamine 5'-phosphate oxidase family protein [Lachnoclostridium sp.]MCM1210168.1 pyridoxamine 5'-phosphate oxidase family protein [Blautia sp.]